MKLKKERKKLHCYYLEELAQERLLYTNRLAYFMGISFQTQSEEITLYISDITLFSVSYEKVVLENKITKHDLTNVDNVILDDGRIMLDIDYIVECVNLMLEDEGVLEVIRRGDEYHLMENATYLFEKVETIFDESYLPTMEDVLKMRYPTKGVTKSDFTINARKFVFIDVGGQRGERRKWIHCFDRVKVIMFLASIAEYDQAVESPKYGDGPTNRMVDSLEIFKWIMNYHYFCDTSTVLFLNKYDIYLKKIMVSDICHHFPEYTGPTQDAHAGSLFIQQMFQSYSTRRYLYTHVVECTDTTGTFATIFTATTEEISRKYIGDLV
ncbi:guanine nucleotide-binding protein G(q) subunit alpha-like isoform X2 [Oratosquilla oratoria]|uniref:guanine nucleotide-binding protein G(q) subunit alpha-like isoform X2 n=1 Tax=Oratosquilla oratoria TaxID=337810 RepID=UPI003F75B3F1